MRTRWGCEGWLGKREGSGWLGGGVEGRVKRETIRRREKKEVTTKINGGESSLVMAEVAEVAEAAVVDGGVWLYIVECGG